MTVCDLLLLWKVLFTFMSYGYNVNIYMISMKMLNLKKQMNSIKPCSVHIDRSRKWWTLQLSDTLYNTKQYDMMVFFFYRPKWHTCTRKQSWVHKSALYINKEGILKHVDWQENIPENWSAKILPWVTYTAITATKTHQRAYNFTGP